MGKDNSSEQTIGYKYYLDMHLVLCRGPVDSILQARVDGKTVSTITIDPDDSYTIDKPELFGGDRSEGGVSGTIQFQNGSPTQEPLPLLKTMLGSNDIPAFRTVVAAAFRQFYIGTSPYLKKWDFRVSRIFTRQDGISQWYPAKAAVVCTGGQSIEDSEQYSNEVLYPWAYEPSTDIADSKDPRNCQNNHEYQFRDTSGTVQQSWDDFATAAAAAATYWGYSLDSTVVRGFSLTHADKIGNGGYGGTTYDPVSNEDVSIYLHYLLSNPSGMQSFNYYDVSDGIPPCLHLFNLAVPVNEEVFWAGTTATPGWFAGMYYVRSPLVGGPAQTEPGDWSTANNCVSAGGSPWTPDTQIVAYQTKRIEVKRVPRAPDSPCYPSCADPYPDWESDPTNFCIIGDTPKSKNLWQLVSGDFKVLAMYSDDGDTVTQYPLNPCLPSTDTNYSTESYWTALYDAAVLAGDMPSGMTYDASGTGTANTYPRYQSWAYYRQGANFQQAGLGLDMNPAHIIRECLTDPDWGLGYHDEDVDDDAFTAAADYLYDECFGLSMLWDREKPVEDFISDVLRHIDAVLYVEPSSGKFVLKLLRDDYAETDLPILDADSVINITDYQKTAFADLVNQVSITYYNREYVKSDSVAVENAALVQQQGTIISTSIPFPGISNLELAARVAERELHALSQQIISCTIDCDRTAADLRPGSPFLLYDDEYNINGVVMRVISISFGDGIRNRIKIRATQDVFYTPLSASVAEPDEAPSSFDTDALDVSVIEVSELPYYLMVKNVGEYTANLILTENAEAGYLMVAAGNPNGTHIRGFVWIDPNTGTYAEDAILDFSPYGSVHVSSNDYVVDKTQTYILLDEGYNLDLVTLPALCQIGDEIMRVDSINETSTGEWEIEVGRGCLDTTPQEHSLDSAGQYLYFIDVFNGISSTEYSAFESVNTKILTQTISDQLTLAEATAHSYVFNYRAIRPYPPGDLRIEGESYPKGIVQTDSADNVMVEWTHRDRTLQTGATVYDHTAGDIGPETNVTYTVRLFDDTDTLISEDTGITITSASVDLSPLVTSTARIDVVSVRDGYESWMAASHRFEWGLVDSVGSYDSVGIDSVGSFDSVGIEADPYFSSVVFLSGFEGSDASTTVLDESSYARTMTCNGNAQIDTAQFKYGSSSALFDGTGDYISTPDAAEFTLGTSDFTFECWVRFNGTAGSQAFFCQWASPAGSASRTYLWDYVSGTGLRFAWNASPSFASAWSPSTGVWYHIAVCRNGADLRFFVDGTQIGATHNISTTSIVDSTSAVGIGGLSGGAGNYVNGWIDEQRITVGVARYTANFTPPAAAFPRS